jgi:hypothetical protein
MASMAETGYTIKKLNSKKKTTESKEVAKIYEN